MRPGPWRLPVRTRLGGLSRIDMKFGSSAACFESLLVLDIRRHVWQFELSSDWGLVALELTRLEITAGNWEGNVLSRHLDLIKLMIVYVGTLQL